MSDPKRDERLKELKRQRRILQGSTHTMLFDLLLLIYEEMTRPKSIWPDVPRRKP